MRKIIWKRTSRKKYVENIELVDSTEAVEFYLKYITPLQTSLFSQIKSVLTLILVVIGTGIVVILSQQVTSRAPLGYLFLGIVTIFMMVGLFIIDYNYISGLAIKANDENWEQLLQLYFKRQSQVYSKLYFFTLCEFALLFFAGNSIIESITF